jgi:hypothetical protein
MREEHDFKTVVEISSYPEVFFDSRDLIMLSISLVVGRLCSILGKGSPKA